MTEYIVKVYGRQIPDAIYERTVGEIIRCRDCVCFSNGVCMDNFKTPWDSDIYVEPDGFCAWGERRES